MKRLLILCLFLAGCEHACLGDNIRQCGYACKDAGKRMQSFSKATGTCTCEGSP